MSEAIARLDYTTPPPGWNESGEATIAGQQVRMVDEPNEPDSKARRRPLAIAWAHYKREHDPPGFTVRGFRFGAGWVADVAVGIKPTAESTLVLVDDNGAVFVDACAARVYAWAWHDRRHALSLRDEARLGLPMMPMSGYLALTDDECTAGEAVAGPGILGSGID